MLVCVERVYNEIRFAIPWRVVLCVPRCTQSFSWSGTDSLNMARQGRRTVKIIIRVVMAVRKKNQSVGRSVGREMRLFCSSSIYPRTYWSRCLSTLPTCYLRLYISNVGSQVSSLQQPQMLSIQNKTMTVVRSSAFIISKLTVEKQIPTRWIMLNTEEEEEEEKPFLPNSTRPVSTGRGIITTSWLMPRETINWLKKKKNGNSLYRDGKQNAQSFTSKSNFCRKKILRRYVTPPCFSDVKEKKKKQKWHIFKVP